MSENKNRDLEEIKCLKEDGKMPTRQKKWQVTYIAPLQPFTLAAFLPWGSSIGAGRIRLAVANVGE